jgi:hypothetical protein
MESSFEAASYFFKNLLLHKQCRNNKKIFELKKWFKSITEIATDSEIK